MTRTPQPHWSTDLRQIVGAPSGVGSRPPGDDRPPPPGAGVAVVVVALAVVGLLLLPTSAERAATPTTIPAVSTTAAGNTAAPPAPDAPAPSVRLGEAILGAGWEELDAGPMAGRLEPAAAWTGSRLFVWGGFDSASSAPPGGPSWRRDGALYDPVTGRWTPVAPLPESVCPSRGPSVAYAAGEIVVLRLRTHWRPDCATAAAYRPNADSWEPLRAEFFRRVTWLKPMTWTGELFVAPRDGLTYDWLGGQTLRMPPPPRGWEDSVQMQQAHWSGERVIALGSSGVFTWAPGDEAWNRVGPAVSARPGSAGAWTDHGFVVVDHRQGAELFDDGEWLSGDGLPLVLHSCPVAAVSVGGTPAVRMCSGLAIWDPVRATWIPVPLDDVAAGAPFGTVLVGSDDALYSVGPSLRRMRIEHGPDGSVVPAQTIPVGTMQLDVPDGFRLVSSFASAHGTVDRLAYTPRSIPDAQTIGVLFASEDGARCTVTSTLTPAGGDEASWPVGLEESGPIAVHRPERPTLEGTEWRGEGDGLAFAFAGFDAPQLLYRFDDVASELLLVHCTGPMDGLPDAASAIAAGLWSPWESVRGDVPLAGRDAKGGPGTSAFPV